MYFLGGASNAAHRLIYSQDAGSHPTQSKKFFGLFFGSSSWFIGSNGPVAIDAALDISQCKQNYGSPSAVQGQVNGINMWVRNGGADGIHSDTIGVEANVSSFGSSGGVFGFEMLVSNYNHASVEQYTVDVQGGFVSSLTNQAYGFVANISHGAGTCGVIVQETDASASWASFFQANDNTAATVFNVSHAGVTTSRNFVANAPSASAWAFDASGCTTISVANGSDVALPAGRGFVYIEESTGHNAAMYMMGGGAVNIVTWIRDWNYICCVYSKSICRPCSL